MLCETLFKVTRKIILLGESHYAITYSRLPNVFSIHYFSYKKAGQKTVKVTHILYHFLYNTKKLLVLTKLLVPPQYARNQT